MRAMIVDDSRAMRTILRRLLADCGYTEIGEAANGREGLDMLNAGYVPELLLVDWNMPEMSGIELVSAVREHPEWSELILVMITTETSIDRIEEALSRGADEYVMKPFTKDVLLEKLEIIKAARTS